MKKSNHRSRRPRAARRNGRPLDLLAETIARCRHLTTLAELLEHCGRIRSADLMEPHLVGNIGTLMAAESQAVGKFLQQLEARGRV